MTTMKLNELLSPYHTYAARSAAEMREAIRRSAVTSWRGDEDPNPPQAA
ncbi:MAG TPA: hypothetical protein VFK41_07230 [Nocardioidaceae bacterium]|nr:hypothetical protein [Nocardioidaceae bacterium]